MALSRSIERFGDADVVHVGLPLSMSVESAMNPHPRRSFRKLISSGPLLLIAFAFAVMADPVSSVAYAVEAALRALNGDLALLLPTMSVVVGIIVLVVVNYRQIIARYPEGGGAAAATGEAFGDGWAFIPIGALIVDFVLTLAVSVSAGASAIIAYFPPLEPLRLVLVLTLILIVAGVTWFGHLGRLLFALLTIGFVIVALVVLVFGIFATPLPAAFVDVPPPHPPVLAVILAFPVAMALATGVEAPSTAIAELGELDDAGRRRVGRTTLVLTVAIVGTITLGLAGQAARLGIGVPPEGSTQLAELARVAAPPWLFAAFQLMTALILLAAASSALQAGPGLLKALAEHRGEDEHDTGILPAFFGRTNAHFTPVWGVVVFTALAIVVALAAGGHDQILVLFYAVSVFVSFLAGLLAMAHFSHAAGHRGALAVNVVGAIAVGFTLVANLVRVTPLVSLAAALGIAAFLYVVWARAGKPPGIRHAEADAGYPEARGHTGTGDGDQPHGNEPRKG